jgi:hypothetical protein
MCPTEQEDVIHPDTTPPVQFDALWRRSAPPAAVRALLFAMLEQAAMDLQSRRFRRWRGAWRVYSEARQWVMADDRSHPFSFVNICEALKLSPDRTRSGMMGIGREALTRAA